MSRMRLLCSEDARDKYRVILETYQPGIEFLHGI